MGRAGRPTATVTLSDEDREVLERWARRPTTAQALAMRARIVLAAAEGVTNIEIAGRVGCHPVTAGKWRNRFVEAGVDGLHDEPRPGAPRSLTDADVERVIVTTLEQQPTDATHCSKWSRSSTSTVSGHRWSVSVCRTQRSGHDGLESLVLRRGRQGVLVPRI